MKHGLLNPEVESAVCLKLMHVIEKRIAHMQHELTSVTLERETYLEKIGAMKEARALLAAQQQIHDREFKV